MEYKFLLDIGLIILVVKLFTIITQRVQMPRLLGGLIAGILLGPSVLNIVQSSSILEVFTTLAIIFIMFLAGMEAKLKGFFANTKKYFTISIVGIAIPLALGFLISTTYVQDFTTNLFLGLVLTSTSVSITVESLMQLNKLHTKAGMAILGAGVVDDIIGIIFLSIILNGGNISLIPLTITIGQVLLFFIVAGGIGFIIYRLFEWLELSKENDDKMPTFSLAFALILAFLAERFGVSGIIGAYIAGVIVGNTNRGRIVKPKIELIVLLIFSPIFAASLGLKLNTYDFSIANWIFIIVFAFIAIVGKIIGNNIGAKLCNYSKEDAINIGIGMACRGEIALVMLDTALESGLISHEIFSMVLVAIVIIAFVAPVLLQIRLRRGKFGEEIITDVTTQPK